MNWIRNTFLFFFGPNRAGLWTAIFSGILAYFTYQLVQVSQVTNDTSRSSQRAFISFNGLANGARMVGGIAPAANGEWIGQQIFLGLVNSGNTPAGTAVIQTGIHDWPEDLPKGYQFPLDADKTQAAIGPKAPYAVDRVIARSALQGYWRQKTRIFIWGDVLYRDIFKGDPERLTEFCIEITHLTIGWNTTPAKGLPAAPTDIDTPNVGLAGFQWQACKEHNCYDEDCSDYSERIKDMR